MPRSVLLIDDNAIQAATRQAILRRAGYYVIATLSAERALAQVQAGDFAIPLGLVITDHVMPGMTGSVFVRALRKTHPSLPVMVISGMEEAAAEYEGLDVVFRVKPLLPEVLLLNVLALMQANDGSAESSSQIAQASDSQVSQESGSHGSCSQDTNR